jgi:hypothetical protein
LIGISRIGEEKDMQGEPDISTGDKPEGRVGNLGDALDRDDDIATQAGATEAPPEPEALAGHDGDGADR